MTIRTALRRFLDFMRRPVSIDEPTRETLARFHDWLVKVLQIEPATAHKGRGCGYCAVPQASLLRAVAVAIRDKVLHAIALREGAAHGLGLRRRFAQQAAGRGHLVGQLPVLGRIDVRQPAPQHRDGSSTGSQRAAMRRGVDAARQAADDRESGACQAAGQAFGLRHSVLRGMTRADDRDR